LKGEESLKPLTGAGVRRWIGSLTGREETWSVRRLEVEGWFVKEEVSGRIDPLIRGGPISRKGMLPCWASRTT